MSLDPIRSFVVTVSKSSLTKAALALGVSKSTISEHIHALERELGAQLLLTTTRSISLTPLGRIYYEQCAAALTELEAAGEDVKRFQTRPTGTLKVTAPVEMAVFLLAPHFVAFSEEYPQIRLELNLSSQNLDLRGESLDVALRFGVIEDADFIVRPLTTIKRHLFASPAYLEKAGRPERPNQLSSHRCLVFPRLGGSALWTLTRGRQSVEVKVSGPISVNSMSFVKEAVIHGFGIGILPAFMSEELEAKGQICKVLPEWSMAQNTLNAVTPSRHLLTRTRLFIKFLQARLA